MNKKEKKKLARKLLKRNGYSNKEIDKILGYAFDGKKADDRRNNNQN